MEDKAHAYLVDWTVDYLKSRNAFLKNLEMIDKNKGGFDVYAKFTDKEKFFLVKPIIHNFRELASKLAEDGHYGIVTFNTDESFKALVESWDELAKIKDLTVYFVNPASQLDKKWMLCPYVHNNVCDRTSLEKGLKSMQEMVDVLTEREIAGFGSSREN